MTDEYMIRGLRDRIAELQAEVVSLRQQNAELLSRTSNLSGLVIETYQRNSSRLRADDEARPPPWASE
jgi:hypothetical protein